MLTKLYASALTMILYQGTGSTLDSLTPINGIGIATKEIQQMTNIYVNIYYSDFKSRDYDLGGSQFVV